jgi:hypothetical protein
VPASWLPGPLLVGDMALYQIQDLLADGSVFRSREFLDLRVKRIVDSFYLKIRHVGLFIIDHEILIIIHEFRKNVAAQSLLIRLLFAREV